MNPLAQSLNEQLQQSNATALSMLSNLGQNMFYPKGILSQSAEAKVQSIMQQLEWRQISTENVRAIIRGYV